MVSYNKDVSEFKKWLPIKTWLGKQKVPSSAPQSVALACDQVNRAVNGGFVYQRDGLSDVWYTPDQFVKFHGGDCEDFSIYKMHRLAQMGVKMSQMEIVICVDKKSREYHAVLRVFAGNSQYILDNQTVKVMGKDSYNARYSPIYAIGTSGWRACSA
jgi:predicted transglutaminase-like cysteine proteinase